MFRVTQNSERLRSVIHSPDVMFLNPKHFHSSSHYPQVYNVIARIHLCSAFHLTVTSALALTVWLLPRVVHPAYVAAMNLKPRFPIPLTPQPWVTLSTCHRTETVCTSVCVLFIGMGIFIWITVYRCILAAVCSVRGWLAKVHVRRCEQISTSRESAPELNNHLTVGAESERVFVGDSYPICG